MNFNFIKKSFVALFLLGIVFLPCLSFAQVQQQTVNLSGGGGQQTVNLTPSTTTTTTTNIAPVVTKITNPISVNNLNDFIKTILVGVIKIGIPIVALSIIYSGFLFVAARGNSEKLKTAKNALMYSLIGAAILLGSWAIAQLISNTVLAL